MKTSTFLNRTIFGFIILASLGASQAFAHPDYYYSSYGDRLTWSVPQQVLYRVHQSFYDFDLVHVRQIPAARYTSYEFILEKRGRFIAVYADRFGRVQRSTWIVNAPFAVHSCDRYCGFHGDHFQRFSRPRPSVIINNRPYHKPGKGNHKHGHDRGNNGWEKDDHRHDYRGDDGDYKEYNSNGYRYGRSDR